MPLVSHLPSTCSNEVATREGGCLCTDRGVDLCGVLPSHAFGSFFRTGKAWLLTMSKVLEMRLVSVVVAWLCILNASGAWSQAADPDIFVNVDCGATQNAQDPTTGLTWNADAPYISTGVPSSNVPKWRGFPELDTLRFFNDTRFPKYCYHLPVISGSTYMLRADFYYGVYDNGNTEPSFQMTIDGLVVANVTSTRDNAYYFELTYVAKGNTTFLCLVRDQTNSNPYISSICLRRVNAYPNMYKSHLSQGFMASTRARYSFGASDTPRYPDDIYDRFWFTVNTTESNILSSATPLQVLNTTKTLLYAGGNADYAQVPEMVLQSALTSSSRMSLKLSRDVGDSGFLFLHFAELDPAVNATSRVFTVNTSSGGMLLVNPLNDSLAVDGNASGWMIDDLYFSDKYTETADFIPTFDSVYGPIINALEFFEYLNDTSRPKTLEVDALAIDSIKSSLSLGEWTGDPCVPVPHTWVNCSIVDPPTIESVNLSEYKLAGTIPVAFAKLRTLTSLVLSGNSFVGELPDLSSLINLQRLDLQDNNLTGSLPEWLGNLKSLTKLYVQNNNFSGVIPATLNRTGLTFQFQPGNALSWTPIKPPPKKINIGIIIGSAIGGVVAILGIILIVWWCVRKRRRSGTYFSTNHGANAAAADALVDDGRVPNAGSARSFSVAELTRATENFKREIGRGGFGSVYYGKLPKGEEVAVKVLGSPTGNQGSNQGETEFFNEVDVLSRVHHRNLVSLLGFCNETGNQMLVYEYLPQGSLRDRLNASGKLGVLDFKARLNVALNAAQGLEYLHTGCNPCIVHRDVKSSNILLTNTKEAAKVADFGLSKLFPGEDGSVTVVKGSRGYIDPEYVTTHYLTSKSDVYSFGVVLLELLTGRVPLPSASQPQSDFAWTLCDWVRRTLQNGGDPDVFLDSSLHACHPDKEAVWKVTDLAMMCVEPKSIHRPPMAEVVQELRSALTLEEANTGAPYHHQQQQNQRFTSTSTSTGLNSMDFNSNIPTWPAAR